jgi:hypothetical protein
MRREAQIINPVEKFKEPEWKNVFALDEKALGELRERVDRNKGVVRLAVHPLFDVHKIKSSFNSRSPKWYNSEQANKIRDGFLKTLESQGSNTPPVIIMEEMKSLKQTKEYIEHKYLFLKSPLYYVPTHDKTSEPMPNENSKLRDYENWHVLINFLHKINARKIIISGMWSMLQLRVTPRDEMADFMNQRKTKGAENLYYDVVYCVGETYKCLARDFEIDISGMTLPVTRTDLIKIEQHKNKY